MVRLKNFKLGAVLLVALLAPLGAEAGVAGKWKTNWGDITLFDEFKGKVTGTVVSQMRNGWFFGEEAAHLLSGYWVQYISEFPCWTEFAGTSHWGQFIFEFNSDFTELSGRRGYCETTPDFKWMGKKISDPARVLREARISAANPPPGGASGAGGESLR